ncbi:hypothetical protein [Piscinibacterium candidicorallinum]|uniref:Uncharacterized protein n=1 Tax=Piscinibacterium candidicorallinum TaxID=1793872 RepID=A0ABV7H2G1_9BURK
MQKNSIQTLFTVQAQRHRGRPISTGRRGGIYQGVLTIRDLKDPHLNRVARCAELADPGNRLPLLPTLIDAQVVHMTPAIMVISGWERLPDNRGEMQGYQQTWWCSLAQPSAEPGQPARPTFGPNETRIG